MIGGGRIFNEYIEINELAKVPALTLDIYDEL